MEAKVLIATCLFLALAVYLTAEANYSKYTAQIQDLQIRIERYEQEQCDYIK